MRSVISKNFEVGYCESALVTNALSCLEVMLRSQEYERASLAMCSVFEQILDAERVFCLRLNEATSRFETVVHGSVTEIPIQMRFLYKIFAEQKLYVINEAQGDKRFDPRLGKMLRVKVRNAIALPIKFYKGGLSGILIAVNKKRSEKKGRDSD